MVENRTLGLIIIGSIVGAALLITIIVLAVYYGTRKNLSYRVNILTGLGYVTQSGDEHGGTISFTYATNPALLGFEIIFATPQTVSSVNITTNQGVRDLEYVVSGTSKIIVGCFSAQAPVPGVPLVFTFTVTN